MLRRFLVVSTLLTGMARCSFAPGHPPTAPTDAGPMPDTESDDAIDDADPEAPVRTPLSLPPGPPYTHAKHARPIYAHYCGGCHTADETEGRCDGATCFVGRADLLAQPGCCSEGNGFATCGGKASVVPGTTLAHCTLRRIRDTITSTQTGSGPLLLDRGGPILVDEEHVAILDAWVAAGQPQ